MKRRMLMVSLGAATLGLLIILTVVYRHRMSAQTPVPQSPFAAAVDLAPLGLIAVYDQGRLKSFDSFAGSMMQMVSGRHEIRGNSDAFSYLDLMLRPGEYEDKDTISSCVRNVTKRRADWWE